MNVKTPVVFVIDDDPSVLKTLPRALEQHNLNVMSYESADAFLEDYNDEHGCLVLDLCMPDKNGLELQTELQQRKFSIPIIFISAYGGVSDSVQAVRGGALNFLEKPFKIKILIESIDEAFQLDATNRARITRMNEKRRRISTLTNRQRLIFDMLINSTDIPSSKVIARILNISYRTVEHHRATIMEKTGVSSVAELRHTFDDMGADRLSETDTGTHE